MAKRKYCCWGKKVNTDEEADNQTGMIERSQQEDQRIKKRIESNKKLLREDLYKDIMKPYFQAGYDYKEFTKTFFGKEYYTFSADAKGQEEDDNEGNQNWCERNLIIKDPSKSKIYILWELIFMVAMLIEATLVPFTACTDIEHVLKTTIRYEQFVDAVWLIQIVVSFITPYTREVEKVIKCSDIAEKYIKEKFFFDILSTLPCVLTLYNPAYINYTYLTKILRVAHYLRFISIIEHQIIDFIVGDKGVFTSVSKQTKSKIIFTTKMTLNLLFLMHLIACVWLLVGDYALHIQENDTYHGSWIDNYLSPE